MKGRSSEREEERRNAELTSSPPDLLPPLVLLRVRQVVPLPEDGKVGGKERVSERLDEGEDVRWRRTGVLELLRLPVDGRVGIQIVEEDSSDSSFLLSMGDVEVLVAPLLELGVVGLSVLVARVLVGLMEVFGVLFEEVVGSEIGSSSEPGGDGLSEIVGVVGLEVSVVHVALNEEEEKKVRRGSKVKCWEEKGRTVGAIGLLA